MKNRMERWFLSIMLKWSAVKLTTPHRNVSNVKIVADNFLCRLETAPQTTAWTMSIQI